MNVYLLLIGALVVAGLVAGSGYKGYTLGQDNIRAEYAIAVEGARKAAEATRQADQQAARKAAQNLQAALGKQRTLTRHVDTQLEAALRREAHNRPAGCPDPVVSDGVRDLINRALAGGAGLPGGVLPSGSKPAADADGPKLPGADPPASVGR